MRLLKRLPSGDLSLLSFEDDNAPPYAILSHTWVGDQEVTYPEFVSGSGKQKSGYDKILFCVDQAAADGIEYSWVDTCCIDKATNEELTTAINSMFRWYQHAAKCYVYLSDAEVPDGVVDPQAFQATRNNAFRQSRWFTRGWTLQELLAPAIVEFFSKEKKRLGSKISLEQEIHEITGVPIEALRPTRLSEFSVDERMSWAAKRATTKKEDKAYCLLGILGIFLPLIYGEGEEHAMQRLQTEAERRQHSRETRIITPFSRAGSKRKRSPSISRESRTPRQDSIRTAISKMQKLSNYIQTQLRENPAERIVRRLETILDATKQFGCRIHGHQEHHWSDHKDYLRVWKQISVNSCPPTISTVQNGQIERRSDRFTFEHCDVSLTTTRVHSNDERGREVLQSVSALRLRPCCSNTGSSVVVFFGERLDFFHRSIIHPVILAYRNTSRDSEVFRMIAMDDVGGMKRLLAEQRATTRDCDELGASLLQYACYYASPLCCRFLIESGADVNRLESAIYDPLEYEVPLAAAHGNDEELSECHVARSLQCRRYLLEAGADPTIEGASFRSVIACAFGGCSDRRGSTASIDLILRYGSPFIDLTLPLHTGLTPWLYAGAAAGFLVTPMVFQSLYNAGCDANETDAEGWNCLFHCVLLARLPDFSKEIEATVHLLRLPINRHATDLSGRTIYDYVNNEDGHWFGSYHQDLWYCALKRAGFDDSEPYRNEEYTERYTPRHYHALRHYSTYPPDWESPVRWGDLDGRVQTTTEECAGKARIEEVSDESLSPLDDEMEEQYWEGEE